MDPTQRIDPNRTQLGGPGFDPLRTQAIAGLGGGTDLGRTTALESLRALEVKVTPSREATMANGPAREQFLVEIASTQGGGPGVGMTSMRTPLNLCLVIDRSGSMEGPPLDYVKQACAYVVDLLSPDDVLSIVTFEEMVDVLMPPQRVTNRAVIKDGIARLVAGNTTNLYDGLSLGVQQVMQVADPGRATRLVVFSDGDPTAGIRDFGALVQHVGEIKSRGVTCTFLGFGPDYNEELLAAMAKKAGGNYYYIPRPEMIPEVFRAELEKLMTVVARNLRLEVKLARWVEMRVTPTSDVVAGSREFTLSLADVERGAAIHQVFDFEYPNHPLGFYRVAWGRLTYDDGITGRTETVDIDMILEFTADAARYSVAPNPLVAQASQVAAAGRTVEKTLMGLKSNQITASMAVADLQKTQAILVAQGRTQEAQEVTMALRAIQSGQTGEAEKTLMGALVHLDQGKTSN
ncbi:MAG: vWA domain-containing protein [Fimbriimonadaceae bacterium]